MENKKKLIFFIILVLICIYMYAINGEKLNKKDILWLTKIPIAHKGLDNGNRVENSRLAFQNAVDKGYAIELDVQLTKDNEVVVFHDDNLYRLTNVNKDVKDITYKELKKLKLKNTEETIPTLEEVLNLVDGKVPLLVEIKNTKEVETISNKTYNILKSYKGKYAIQSFNPFILEWFKNNASEVIRGQLSSSFTEDKGNLKFYEIFLLKNLLLNFKSKPNFISYELKGTNNLSFKILKLVNYPTLSWTIKNEKEMNEAYKVTDNIIFDNILP